MGTDNTTFRDSAKVERPAWYIISVPARDLAQEVCDQKCSMADCGQSITPQRNICRDRCGADSVLRKHQCLKQRCKAIWLAGDATAIAGPMVAPRAGAGDDATSWRASRSIDAIERRAAMAQPAPDQLARTSHVVSPISESNLIGRAHCCRWPACSPATTCGVGTIVMPMIKAATGVARDGAAAFSRRVPPAWP